MATPESPQRNAQKLSASFSSGTNPQVPVRFYDFDCFRIDVHRRRLLRDGEPVPITPKALETLLVLVANHGRVVEKDDLMSCLWPDTVVEEANLTQNIFLVRKILGEAPGEQTFIATLPRRGYQFVGQVRKVAKEEDQVVPKTEIAEGIDSLKRQLRAPDAEPSRWRSRWVVVLAVFVIAALAPGIAAMWNRWLAGSTIDPIRAIAVLPLRNLSGDPEQEYFADGMTEAIINDLASFSALRVVSHQSMIRYKRSAKTVPEIARELGVDGVIEGSITPTDGRIRLTVRLLHGRNDRQLWAASYDRRLDDVLSLQAKLAREVAEVVKLAVSEQERAALADRRSVEPEAYDLYLRSRQCLTRREFRKSLEYSDRAITKDPTFAVAYAGMAQTYAVALGGDLGPPSDMHPRLKAAARKALELDPRLIDAHLALAATTLAHEWNWQEGERALRRILERNPNNETAQLWYAWLLVGLGRHTEALALHERALAADPLSPNNNSVFAASLRQVGRYRDAADRYQRILERDPHFAWAHRGLGWTYLEMGMDEKGLSALEEAARLAPDNASIMASLGHAYGRRGRDAEAKAVLWHLEELAYGRYTSPVFMAMIHAGLGERDAAFGRLEEAYRERDPILTRVKVDPLLQPLRTDPRFSHLVQRMNLPLP